MSYFSACPTLALIFPCWTIGGFPKKPMLSRTWFLKIISFIFFSSLVVKALFLKKFSFSSPSMLSSPLIRSISAS